MNETLVLQFSDLLDASSVTPASAAVVQPGGARADGEFEVQRHRLLFRPRAPRSRDLSDGGLLPDRTYEVLLSGFPRPDGLRSRDGSVLSRSVRLRFHTARLDGPTPLFEDPTPDGALPLRLASAEVGPLDPILLRSADPLDPTSLRDEDFRLLHFLRTTDSDGSVRTVQEVIALRALITENGTEGALVELRPTAEPAAREFLEPGTYRLWIEQEGFALRDFGGNPVLPPPGGIDGPLLPVVVRSDVEAPRLAVHLEPFLDPGARSPQAVAGAEGAAHWGTTGVVTVRLPRAVGDGRAGAVALRGEESRTDVQAVRLALGEGESVRLAPPGGGLVVLRSQGRIVLDGDLERAHPDPSFARHASESWRDWRDRLGRKLRSKSAPPEPGREVGREPGRDPGRDPVIPPTLEQWLADAEDSGEPWTVLVAGGDVEIRGNLRLEGPLLVAAAGWLRVTGSIEASEVWKVGEGGGQVVLPPPSTAWLRLPEPELNPLREPMTWAVLSAPHRPPFGVRRWLPARLGGTGDFRVGFLGERDRPGGDVEVIGPVEDPVRLAGCDAVRLRIELTVAPGGTWDPPRLDFVELAWDEAE